MGGFGQRATAIGNGVYATITVSVTAPCENKVGWVRYPHVSQKSAIASGLDKINWPVDKYRDKAENNKISRTRDPKE